jgi:hypothetical protein
MSETEHADIDSCSMPWMYGSFSNKKNLGENDVAFQYLRASRWIKEISGENFAGEPKQFRR